MLANGYYKVAEDGFSLTRATFFNPTTGESYSKIVWDNDDYRVEQENEVEYHEPIDDEVRRVYLNRLGVIQEGDTIKVIKGRKVPKGTIAKVVGFRDWKDNYGRVQATYVLLDNGMKTNVDNCILA